MSKKYVKLKRVPKKLIHKYADLKTFHKQLSVLLFVAIIAAIGTYILTNSHASTPYASVTSSSGSLSSGAKLSTSCSGASTGSCVTFNSALPMDGSVALALSSPGVPFSSTSFWNTPLPASTPVNVNNAAYSNDIMATFCGNAPNGSTYATCPNPSGKVALSIYQYSVPLYVVPASQPKINVKNYCPSGAVQNANFVNAVLSNVPVPTDAHGASGTDMNMQIYQPSSNTYWDFWQFQRDSSGNPEACYGGIINGAPTSNGIFSAFGGSGSGLPFMGGVGRIEELQAGQIDHVLGIELTQNLLKTVLPANTSCATSGISWPAPRSDGTNTNNLATPEGLRFRLPASFNLTQYNANLVANKQSALSPIADVIATTAQKYGFVLYDTAPNVAIRLGDPTTYTAAGLPDPYTTGTGVGGVNNGNLGLLGGLKLYQVMQNFPWDQLQALQFNYGSPNLSAC